MSARARKLRVKLKRRGIVRGVRVSLSLAACRQGCLRSQRRRFFNSSIFGESALKKQFVFLLIVLLFASGAISAQRANVTDVNLAEIRQSPGELSSLIQRYVTDRGSLERFFVVPMSPLRQERFRRFNNEWLSALEKLNFDSLSRDDQIDYLLFKNYLNHELSELSNEEKRFAEIEPLVPFARTIIELSDNRQQLKWIEPSKAANLLNDLNGQIEAARKQVEANAAKPKKTVANRAARMLTIWRGSLKRWFDFYNAYDPNFSWWNAEPYKTLDKSLENYSNFLLDKIVNIKPDDKTTIIGDPIGREALLSELAYEMIPYTPEELIEIANKEFAWCEREMLNASRELGFGDDWRKALEHVKNKHVAPGEQPELIRGLALEAIEFLDKNDLVTIPALARETWRMEMMSPERQLVAPFFLGGETILVAFPTSGMTHEQKMMSMRGNNRHFVRAVVHHELIPGHHLQGFMGARYRPYRQLFRTPFSVEGWALYWELLLWDLNFAKTPEDRIGMLFWRMHRCARIIFSLSFHLEKMTPQEAVDFLFNRVGHERDNATAEVRRSFAGDYGPLYQAAYLLGGIQIRGLRKELVDSGKMSNRAFHDAVLKQNSIPIEMLRAALTNQKLTRDYKSNWNFYK